MLENEFQQIIFKRVLIYNFILYLILILLYILQGYDNSAFFNLMSILTPTTAIFMRAMYEFHKIHKYVVKDNIEKRIRPQHIDFSLFLISIHFWTLILAIILSALFKSFISNETLMILFTLEETIFGIFVSKIIIDTFKNQE